ncbi:anaphase-promoting complex subunit 4 isoform X2 [Tetranychus urticae]|nr:anaphase-promoting complex subunit 4 isoform X2 [Tetranychus urticae]
MHLKMVCFRQHDDRHVSHKIKLMRWNTLMDLIAIGMKNGDVSIHRLVNWQKIWVLTWPNGTSPSTENNDNSGKSSEEGSSSRLDITAMEWRPDGKVLAVAYNRNVKKLESKEEMDSEKDSSIALVDIENGEVITTITCPSCLITCMSWQFKSNFYLNDRYKLTEDGIDDVMKVCSQPNFNILAIGTSTGFVFTYIFGVLLVGVYELKDRPRVEHVSFTSDLCTMSVLTGTTNPESSTNSDNFQYQSFFLPTFGRNSEQYFIVSHIYAKTFSLLSYLEDIIGSIQETMEDILLELDSKLTSYLQPKGPKNSNGSVLLADELLELLVVGTFSDSLEKFLHQLTDKGLRKLGRSIETTYLTIQRYVVCNVQRCCKHIFSHLNVLRAISLWKNEFDQIGLKTQDINRAIHGVATFYLKSLELQQVIDSSCQNLVCFFRWLLSVTVRFYNDSMPSSQQDSIKISPQDLQYVADFIEENFDCQDNHQDDSMSDASVNRPTATNFTLERVCQYLKPEPLVYRTFAINDQSLNPWFKYLKERPMLVNEDNEGGLILYKHNVESSLITEHRMLVTKARDAFKAPKDALSDFFEKSYDSNLKFTLSLYAKETPKVTHASDEISGFSYIAIAGDLEVESEICILKILTANPSIVHFVLFTVVVVENGAELETNPIDIQFYTESILSMLLVTKDSQYSYLLQLPLASIENNFLLIASGASLQNLRVNLPILRVTIDSTSEIAIRRLDNFKPSQFAVSGSRKVCCISSRAKRRVRVFEMDGNEEEAEEESEIFE